MAKPTVLQVYEVHYDDIFVFYVFHPGSLILFLSLCFSQVCA